MKHWLLLWLIGAAAASEGDALPAFGACVEHCKENPDILPYSAGRASRLLLGWTVHLDCKYRCSRVIAVEREAQGLPPVQFFGKWVFSRIFGVTEVASALLSVLNLHVNYRALRTVKRGLRTALGGARTMLEQYRLLLIVLMAGWLCSAVFHTRDVPLTETLDYFGAAAIMVANLNAISVRFFGLYQQDCQKKRLLFQHCLLALTALHFFRLLVSWDYAYNMRFNVVVGLSASFLWILLSFRVYTSTSHFARDSHYARIPSLKWMGHSRALAFVPATLNVYLIACMAFEILDFPPYWGLVDAHAVWHLCTIFSPLIWYDWNMWDLDVVTKRSIL